MEEEWKGLPGWGIQKLPITSAIPYYFRWKINQIKLMLQDLEFLKIRYGIRTDDLMETVKKEALELCIVLNELIKLKQEARKRK